VQARGFEVVAPDYGKRHEPVLDHCKPRAVCGMDRAGRSGALDDWLRSFTGLTELAGALAQAGRVAEGLGVVEAGLGQPEGG
jgi:hypothetical protein